MVVRALSVLVLLLVAGTATGVILLWPEDREIPRPPELGAAPDTEKAEVVGVRAVPSGWESDAMTASRSPPSSEAARTRATR